MKIRRLITLMIEFAGVVLVPAVYLFNLYLIAYQTSEVSLPTMIVGLVVACVGIGFWIISYVQLGRGFGVLPTKQKRVRTGIYRRFKHPMYLGIMLCFVGLSVAMGSWTGFWFTIGGLLPLLIIRAYWEERYLEEYARTT